MAEGQGKIVVEPDARGFRFRSNTKAAGCGIYERCQWLFGQSAQVNHLDLSEPMAAG